MKSNFHSAAGKSRGFSMLELIIVLAIITIVGAASVVPLLRTLSVYKLRGAGADLESLIQDTRMRAVRDDTVYTLYPVTLAGGVAAYCLVPLPVPSGAPDFTNCVNYQNGAWISSESVFVVPNGVQIISQANAPAVVPTTGGNAYTQNDGTAIPVAYNARGLPCQATIASGACTIMPGGTPVGFVYYLSATALSSTVYRAVTVTPAGRVKLWSYSGGAWQ